MELIERNVIQPEHANFDLSHVTSQERWLTQKIASLVYDLGYKGIRYTSRHGSNLWNWAVFEPFDPSDIELQVMHSVDEDFTKALQLLDLQFDSSR